MADKKGRGLLMVYTDVPPDVEEEFNRWYNEEHIPERLAIPGVLDAARYVALRGGPKHLAYYELAESDAWYSDAWQHRTYKMSPAVVGTNYTRILYRLIYPDPVPAETAQAGMAPVVLVGRMSVPLELEEQFNLAYNNERLPLCASIPGYIRGRRFQAVMGEPKYITVHEMESEEVPNSPEWAASATTETPGWLDQVRPHMVHAPGSPGVYTKVFPR